ncbi:MAG TPA: hypothetical protein VK680_11595 [Solirubrobacteraceae bacterium]|nr:hypothetical protein [Solirubrobacteraceae bacterium]
MAAHDVLGLGEVAHDVEVAQPLKLAGELTAALRVLAGTRARLGLDRVEHELAQRVVGLEVVQPVDQLLLKRNRGDGSLLAGAVVAAGGALVATHRVPARAAAVHPSAAALAAEQLSQQVLLRWASRLDDPCAPGADFLHAIEQVLGDDRLVQPADAAALVTHPADVARVGEVGQHLAHGVLAEQPAASGAGALRVQPRGEGAVGLLAGGVALEHREHERRTPGVRRGELGGRVADVAPRQRADEMALACLLA